MLYQVVTNPNSTSVDTKIKINHLKIRINAKTHFRILNFYNKLYTAKTI